MDREEAGENDLLFAAIRPVQFLQVEAIGLLVGAFSWIFAEVIGMYFLKPTGCAGDAFSCAASSQLAVILASILAALVGLFGLVKLQVFRPLLIVIATTVSLWGIVGMLATLPWYMALVLVIVMYGVAYAAFMWLARIRIFWFALLAALILAVALRLIITV